MNQPFWKGYYTDVDPNDPDSPDGIVHTINLQHITHEGNQIKGAGSHPQFGNFNIEGTSNNGLVSFKLKYPNKELIFSGKRHHDEIQGSWGNDPEYDVGSFKFTLITPKQGWNGHYRQNNIDREMNISELNIDAVPNGEVIGAGSDENGGFEFEGTYDATNSTVHFQKLYQNNISWKYWGTFANNEIKGSWGWEEGSPLGEFHLYKI